MGELLHISDVVLSYISGDWGEEVNTDGSLVEVACVRGADINNLKAGIFDQLPIRYIKESSLRKNGLQVGNIIIEKSGGSPTQSTGRVAYVSRESLENRENIVCSNFCAAFSIKPEWDSQYIFYYLQYFYNTGVFFNFEGKTSGLHNLQIEQAFKAIPIKKIPLPEQKRIASVLSALDKKIALNRQINQNLEALARQLYDYWFVQFDFPNEEGKPYKSSGGKMVYNPILKREIPEGWEVKEIGAILDKVKSSMKLTTNEFSANGKYPIIDQATDTYYAGFTDREGAVLDQYPAVVFGDHSCAVKYVNFPFVRGADGTQVMISKESRISTEYLYFAVKDVKIGKGYARHYSFLKSSLIIVPAQELALDFHEQVGKLFNQITLNRKQILSLTRQRDGLLPLLMNGQVNFDLLVYDIIFARK